MKPSLLTSLPTRMVGQTLHRIDDAGFGAESSQATAQCIGPHKDEILAQPTCYFISGLQALPCCVQ